MSKQCRYGTGENEGERTCEEEGPAGFCLVGTTPEEELDRKAHKCMDNLLNENAVSQMGTHRGSSSLGTNGDSSNLQSYSEDTWEVVGDVSDHLVSELEASLKNQRFEEDPRRVRSKVSLEFHSCGLMVKGDTDVVRNVLKTLGGRWDDVMKAWLFPFDAKEKIIIGLRVCGHNDTITVEDRAEVRLTLSTFESGILVTGQTFPVKEFLKCRGGIWNATLKGWFFDGYEKVDLRRRLWKCRMVDAIDEITV